ncbi:MAG: B12-binding domain-containing protein, partial [Rickettsiales bacterium]|nr:B12-binding domain-containing protein [Rickettsiales bacterium]
MRGVKNPNSREKMSEDAYIPKKPLGTPDDPYDPLQYFISLFEGRKSEAQAAKKRADTIEGVLKERIIDGDKKGLEDDLNEALKTLTPLQIINDVLLEGMKVVGELFGAGKMQLPFVLQSAETMKKAVAHLEPLMEKVEGQEKGKIVLATVKGDVHDIGKNLVDIILTNNGYKVFNLGIKQPISNIVEAIREHKPDAVGLSGLLVKSTVVMRENLQELTTLGYDLPVLLGGAALTRAYVEEDCVEAYGSGRVAYARDAFDGLDLMNKLAGGEFDAHLEDIKKRKHNRPSNAKAKQRWSQNEVAGQELIGKELRPMEVEAIKLKRQELAAQVAVPTPPFWGARLITDLPTKALIPFLNEQMLFTFHWGFKKAGKSIDEYWKWVETDVKPILRRLLIETEAENILQPKAAYGYFKCAAEGDDLVLFNESGVVEIGRLKLPRQDKDGGICVADFFRDINAPERDVLGMQVVTAGQKVADIGRDWFAANRYQDYLYLHG